MKTMKRYSWCPLAAGLVAACLAPSLAQDANDRPPLALVNYRMEIDERTEAAFFCPPGYVITGIGARCAGDDVANMRIRMNPLLPGGRLGEPKEVFFGWSDSRNLEGNVDLPDGWVAVGFGASGQPEGDIKSFVVWGSPIGPDGKLGFVQKFRSGFHPGEKMQQDVLAEGNRVLTGVGLRMAGHSIRGMRAQSAEIVAKP